MEGGINDVTRPLAVAVDSASQGWSVSAFGGGALDPMSTAATLAALASSSRNASPPIASPEPTVEGWYRHDVADETVSSHENSRKEGRYVNDKSVSSSFRCDLDGSAPSTPLTTQSAGDDGSKPVPKLTRTLSTVIPRSESSVVEKSSRPLRAGSIHNLSLARSDDAPDSFFTAAARTSNSDALKVSMDAFGSGKADDGNNSPSSPEYDPVARNRDGEVFDDLPQSDFNENSSRSTGGVVPLGPQRGSPEAMRVSLLDRADLEALYYDADFLKRRRAASFMFTVLRHNADVEENIRAYRAVKAAEVTASAMATRFTAATPSSSTNAVSGSGGPVVPQTDKFLPIIIPPAIMDPVTKRLMCDPVVFQEKRVMDRASAEGLVFRLMTAMTRCNAIGGAKRKEFFMYYPDAVLVSTVARQFFRHVFGMQGLSITPRESNAITLKEWYSRLMVLYEDVRDDYEAHLMREVGDDIGAEEEDESNEQQATTTTLVIGTQTLHVASPKHTKSSAEIAVDAPEHANLVQQDHVMPLVALIKSKQLRPWETFEKMWWNASVEANKPRKKRGLRRLRRSTATSFNPMPTTAKAAAQGDSPNTARQTKPPTMLTVGVPALGSPVEAAFDLGGLSLLGDTIGSTPSEKARWRKMFAEIEADEVVARKSLETELLKAMQTVELQANVQMQQESSTLRRRAMQQQQQQRRNSKAAMSVPVKELDADLLSFDNKDTTTTTISHITTSTTDRPSHRKTPREVSSATSFAGAASAVVDSTSRTPLVAQSTRHCTVLQAGSNYRAPYTSPKRLNSILGIHSAGTSKRRAVNDASTTATAAEVPADIVVGGDAPQHTSLLPRKPEGQKMTTDGVVLQPQSSGILLSSSSAAQFAEVAEALESVTGLVDSLLAPRKHTDFPTSPPEAGPHAVGLTAEDFALVGAVMRFHQDKALFDCVFDFQEPWFIEMERRAMVWAEEQFKLVAEQQAQAKALSQKKLRYQRQPLRTATCIVAATPSKKKIPAPPPSSSPRVLHEKQSATAKTTAPEERASETICVEAAEPKTTLTASLTQPPEEGYQQQQPHQHQQQQSQDEGEDLTDEASLSWRARIVVQRALNELPRAAVAAPLPPSLKKMIDSIVEHSDRSGSPTHRRRQNPVSDKTTELLRIPLKPPWAMQPKLPQPSPRTRYVEESAIPRDSDQELPATFLNQEAELLYREYDAKASAAEYRRKREMGPYYYEPILFAEEVQRREKLRHDVVQAQLAHTTIRDLNGHWRDKKAIGVTSAESPLDDTDSVKAPQRPFSSTLSARHFHPPIAVTRSTVRSAPRSAALLPPSTPKSKTAK